MLFWNPQVLLEDFGVHMTLKQRITLYLYIYLLGVLRVLNIFSRKRRWWDPMNIRRLLQTCPLSSGLKLVLNSMRPLWWEIILVTGTMRLLTLSQGDPRYSGIGYGRHYSVKSQSLLHWLNILQRGFRILQQPFTHSADLTQQRRSLLVEQIACLENI